MRRLVIQFSSSEESAANWISAAIRRLSHSKFSHVDLVLPDSSEWPAGALLGASDQGPHSPYIKGNPLGVAIRPSDYQRFSIRRRMELEVEDGVHDAVTAALFSQLGKPFDSSGLWHFINDPLSVPDDRDWRQPDFWWCSELKSWGLERGGFFTFPLDTDKGRITPADLRLILLQDTRWVNRYDFDKPVAGLVMGAQER